MRRISRNVTPVLTCVFLMASLLAGVGPFFVRTAHGAQVLDRSLRLSNSVPGQTSTYQISFSLPSSDTLGSIKAEFCSNTALFEVSCDPPAGFDVTSATLSSQSGETGFVIDPLTNANTLVLSRPPAVTPGGVTVTLTLDGVRNADAEGAQFARYSTYSTIDASGADTDRGSVAYSLTHIFQVSAEVPPYLEFCLGITITGTDCTSTSGNYVNMGNFSTTKASTGQTQVVVGTNAANGYSIAMSGSTMNSGNNSIPSLADPTESAPGSSQFGVNLRENTIPPSGQEPSGKGTGSPVANYNHTNKFVYHDGDIIASKGTVDDYRKFTVTYLVNISRFQEPGAYSSTFTYTGYGNF
jgi:hypothetical protein